MPAGAEAIDFAGEDGGYLRAGLFPLADARATAVLMAGRSEYMEKYFETVRDLHARGIAVAMMDWRGQGLSERLLPVRDKGHIQDFGVFRSDLRRFFTHVVATRMPGPYILMTHSMGGAPGLQILADGDDSYRAAVLCAPMTRLFANPAKRGLVRTLAATACRLGQSRASVPGVKEHSLDFDGNVLTSDEKRHARFRDIQAAGPNATIREPTYGWLHAAMAAMDDLHRPNRFAALTTPTLIISAERDDLVCSDDHALLAARSTLIERVLIKDALHEILMERDIYRDQYWAAFDAFIASHVVPIA